jgi:hypothetical protein
MQNNKIAETKKLLNRFLENIIEDAYSMNIKDLKKLITILINLDEETKVYQIIKESYRNHNELINHLLNIYIEQNKVTEAIAIINDLNLRRNDKRFLSTIKILIKFYIKQKDKENVFAMLGKLNTGKEKKELIDYVLYTIAFNELEVYAKSLLTYYNDQLLLQKIYSAWLNRLIEHPETLLNNTIKIVPGIIKNKGLLTIALYNIAIHFAFISSDTKEARKNIKELSKVIDLQNWINEKPSCEYSYKTLHEWISTIEDDDDREDIERWARRVKKEKWSEDEFERRVKELLK